ncbi:divalent-cation tolerance protein CutA-like [Dermatophagoides pteronyssinus]|uniref:divalent-cation tolerance protein CutA-like n=1 Tax=Dermatophagoides pteronyssinus TaxID=6956 RepID=UPI003F66B5FC
MSRILLSSLLLSSFRISNFAACHYCSATTSVNSNHKMSNESSKYSIGYVTISNAEKAKELAMKLVNENKVACVNIVPTITSIYRWENKLEVDDESLMILKTRTDAIDELIQFIRQNHPYSVPEIIFTPITNGNPDYLKWISSSVKLSNEP